MEVISVPELNSREYAELLGALQVARDSLRRDGYTGDGAQMVLDKVMAGCKPNTCGMRFELIHAGENE